MFIEFYLQCQKRMVQASFIGHLLAVLENPSDYLLFLKMKIFTFGEKHLCDFLFVEITKCPDQTRVLYLFKVLCKPFSGMHYGVCAPLINFMRHRSQ
jgi:hypothetical protein